MVEVVIFLCFSRTPDFPRIMTNVQTKQIISVTLRARPTKTGKKAYLTGPKHIDLALRSFRLGSAQPTPDVESCLYGL